MKHVSLKTVHTEREILEASALAHEIWREHYASILSGSQIEYMLEKFQSPAAISQQIGTGYEYYLIRTLGRTIGYTALKLNDPPPALFLSKIYLLKIERGSGCGKAAFREIDERAARAGQEKIWLTVNKNNPSTAAYTALGFTTVREQVVDIGGGYVMDDYVMERPVASR